MKPRSPSNGGCEVLVAPHHPAPSQPIFWTIEANPAAISLGAGHAHPSRMAITIDDLRPRILRRHSPTLLQLDVAGDRYDVDLADPHDRRPLSAALLLDALTPDRLTSLDRFWSGLTGKPVRPDPRLTLQRRLRARDMLRAVDGDAARETYRAIALHLYPQLKTDPAEWVGSAVREMTIRLTRDGRQLVRGGYLDLMRRPRRQRAGVSNLGP